MTNYDDAWGEAKKSWNTINIQDRYLSSALMVCAWGGMICFFVFGIFAVVTRSETPSFLMLASILVWVIAGIGVIRIRRKAKKVLTWAKRSR